MDDSWDVIVVGLGAMGSAAAYQLAARGVRVLALDQFSPPHPLGSTHGDTRITRLAIGEGFAYVPLALRSHQLWREIESQAGADLLTTNGGLILGRLGSGARHRAKTNFLDQTVAAAKTFDIRHEVLDAGAIGERFPQFNLIGDEVGYYEPDAGFLRPEACVAAQLDLAAQRGAVIRRDERVESYTIHPRGVTVVTTQGRYSAAKLVLSVGPWIADLIDQPLAEHFRVFRQVMHWFATSPPFEQLSPDRCPVYIWEVGATEWFYGFPAIDGPQGGMKVATEQHDESVDPHAVRREVAPRESFAVFDDLVGPRLPQLQRRCVKAVSCLYTSTADGDFVVDWHPDSEDVLVVSPCSGHGFKHSAAIGEAVAELVTSGESAIDLEPFSLGRFERQPVA
jgi:sarcosine oxidase